MGVDTNILGNAGPGHCIEHEGRTYRVSLIDQKAKAAFEDALFRRAVRAAEMIASGKAAGWIDAQLAELNDAYMAGEFALLSDRGLKVLQSPGGAQLLLSILTGLEVSQMVPLLMAKRDQVRAVLNLVIRESFPGVKIDATDPNAQALHQANA